MTPEQRFNRWVQYALLVFTLAFVYFIVSDIHMPLTPESRLLRPVMPVAPQLSPGDYAAIGNAVLALVGDRPDLVADFREKSLSRVFPGTPAKVVFDALPGRIFAAHVASHEAGVSNGQLPANGTLAEPDVSDRWVRDAQRMRIHLVLDQWPEQPLPTGSRATVQLIPAGNPVARALGSVQIYLVSLLHYVY